MTRSGIEAMRAEARARKEANTLKVKVPEPELTDNETKELDRLANGRFVKGNKVKPRQEYEFFKEGTEEFKQALRGLAHLFCSQKEAALVLGLSPYAFELRLQRDPPLRAIWDEGRESGKVSLRMKQMKIAETAPGMAIFLGKNYLGQRDEQHIKKTDERTLKVEISKLSSAKLKTIQGILAEAKKPELLEAEFETVK